jgi:hypothetical protein
MTDMAGPDNWLNPVAKDPFSLASWQAATQPNPPLPEGRFSPLRCVS